MTQGEYVLGIELNSDLTDREVIESFATADGNYNLKYALALDGVVVTDYNFTIDTQLKADTQTSCAAPEADKVLIGGHSCKKGETIPVGTHLMSYNDGRIYDMKVEIDPSSESDASVYGVKINGDGTITAGTDAENRTFKFLVTLIDVNGNISKTEAIDVTFKEAEVSQVTELTPTVYTITPRADRSVVINLGDVFTSLSDADAVALDDVSNITWAYEGDGTKVDDFIITESQLQSANIQYFADANCTQEIKVSDFDKGDKVRSIKYAKIPVTGTYNSQATLGEHILSITLKRQVGSIPTDPADKNIKKVNVPVDVKLPAWEDLFAEADSNWADGEYTSRICKFDASKASIILDAYKAKDNTGASQSEILVRNVEANIDGNICADIRQAAKGTSNPADSKVKDLVQLQDFASVATKDGDLKVTDVTVDFLYKIDHFVIYKEDVKVHIKSMYEDLKLVWLDKDGNETSGPAKLEASTNRIYGTGSAKSPKANGLAFVLDGQYIEVGDFEDYKFAVAGLSTESEQKLQLETGKPKTDNLINFQWEANGENGGTVTISDPMKHTGTGEGKYDKASYITLEPTAPLSSGTIKVTFTDAMGVKHTSNVTFSK